MAIIRKRAMLYEKLDHERVHCFLCAHHCRIMPAKYGFCGVRENVNGELFTHTYGKVVAQNVDPVEKKPLFHLLPGTMSYSIAAIGCNFRCGFCQNWQISQTSEAVQLGINSFDVRPHEIVEQARQQGCASISYTYTEPTIFFEYAHDVALLARREGLFNIFVTNGYLTREALLKIRPFLDAANVDLKSFSEETYRAVCGGRLGPVLDTIRLMHDQGIWVEVTTLVIPGQNDSPEELRKIASFIAGVGVEIPWHISLFHPDYRYLDRPATPAETLRRAYSIGREAGLRYVYRGNIAEEENTYCHQCGELLIRRYLFTVGENRLSGGRCPRCRTELAGRFTRSSFVAAKEGETAGRPRGG